MYTEIFGIDKEKVLCGRFVLRREIDTRLSDAGVHLERKHCDVRAEGA